MSSAAISCMATVPSSRCSKASVTVRARARGGVAGKFVFEGGFGSVAGFGFGFGGHFGLVFSFSGKGANHSARSQCETECRFDDGDQVVT